MGSASQRVLSVGGQAIGDDALLLLDGSAEGPPFVSQVPARQAVSSGFVRVVVSEGRSVVVGVSIGVNINSTHFPCLPTGSAPPDSRYCVGLIMDVGRVNQAIVAGVDVGGLVVMRFEVLVCEGPWKSESVHWPRMGLS